MADAVDFDAAWAEVETAAKPGTFTVQGETIVLPVGLPAKLVLFQVRNRDRLEGASPDPAAVAEMAGMLFGAERVARWVDDGMAMPKLFAAYLAASLAIRGKTASGEARPPETGEQDSSPTSSPDGPPSKATGSGSTDGT